MMKKIKKNFNKIVNKILMVFNQIKKYAVIVITVTGSVVVIALSFLGYKSITKKMLSIKKNKIKKNYDKIKEKENEVKKNVNEIKDNCNNIVDNINNITDKLTGD
jgi:uncharacterized membrane protein